MPNTFAADLRTRHQMAGDLPEQALELLARARDNLCVGRANRDQLLAELLAAYRAGPRQLWSPVILDLLAPALVQELTGLRVVPPLLDEDEIRQQLVLEVLEAAASMPIRGGLDMKFRLLGRARKYVVRWLAREGRRQHEQCSYEAPKELER